MTERQQTIIVAVAAEAPEPHRAAQSGEAPVLVLAGEEVGAGVGEQRFAKTSAGTHAHGLGLAVMTEKGFALSAPEALAGEGLVHQAEQRGAATGQPDKGAPKRQAENEGAGAVDRVDDPAIFGVAPEGAEFFANDAVGRVGLGNSGTDRCFGGTVGRGHRIEDIASFMVNGTACPEMRQYDRAGLVGQGLGRGQKGLKFKLFGIGHGERLEAVLPWESRLRGLGGRRRTGRGQISRDRYASVFRKCPGNVTGTLLFVRRNDILLQRGMALQAIPLPSLGVSSLDLGRSINRAALFLFAVGYSAAARGMASPEMPATSARTMASRSPQRRSNPADLSKLVSSI